MLTIKIEENFKDVVNDFGVDISSDSVVMTVRDGDVLMGAGIMRLYDTYAVIDDMFLKEEYKDFTLEYGLGKSLLNVVDLRGIRYAVSNNKNIEKQLRALKFKAPEELENIGDYPQEVTGWQ